MAIWHVTFSSNGHLPMFPDEAATRRAVRAVVRLTGPQLVMFSLVPDHAHVVAFADSGGEGKLSWALTLGLRAVAHASIDNTDRRLIESRAHAERLLPYLLRQVEHHNLPAHPALWSGSCFQDLVGARAIVRLRLRDALPRIRIEDVLRPGGLGGDPVSPATDDEVRAAGAARIVAAAAMATATGPTLTGRATEVVETRRVAVQLGVAANIPLSELQWALCIAARTARDLRATPAGAAVTRAIRVRLALENRIGGGQAPAPPPNHR